MRAIPYWDGPEATPLRLADLNRDGRVDVVSIRTLNPIVDPETNESIPSSLFKGRVTVLLNRPEKPAIANVLIKSIRPGRSATVRFWSSGGVVVGFAILREGRVVRTPPTSFANSGLNTVTLSSSGLPPGRYKARLQAAIGNQRSRFVTAPFIIR